MKTIPKPLVRTVLERDGGWCLLALPGCMGEASVADHRADRGHGGSGVLNDPACLIAACGICNGAKPAIHGQLLVNLLERGLKVRKAATNAGTVQRCRDTPVEDLEGRWWLLRSDGTREEIDGRG